VRLRTAGGAVGLAMALALAVHLSGVSRSAAPASTPISVAIDQSRPGAPVPKDFLGLSFELSSLPQIARYGSRGDFPAMLRSLGPGVVRFGGVSADTRVAWTDAATPAPAWASSTVDVRDLRALRTLATKSGWRVLLTIGLAHYDARAAAREAAAAKTALGGWLAGIELGNEPDAYARHGLRPEPWTFSRYDAQVAAYRRAIEKAAPGLRLVGPDVSGSQIFERWGRDAAVSQRPALLAGHHYPLGCHDVPTPTISRLLSPRIRQAEEVSLRRYLSVSGAHSIRFRLDETNSVSCGGKAGVSNTFGSALWAVDYIAHTMLAGAVGINLQGNPANCRGYSPVCAPTSQQLADGALTGQPEWYALLLGKELVGARPVRAIVSRSRANVDVIALLGGHGELRVLIVDDDPPGAGPVAVKLHVGSRFGAASVLSLTAPSPAATAGVRLGGRGVGRDGRWRPPARLPRVANRAGVITLAAAPASALLITVPAAHAPSG